MLTCTPFVTTAPGVMWHGRLPKASNEHNGHSSFDASPRHSILLSSCPEWPCFKCPPSVDFTITIIPKPCSHFRRHVCSVSRHVCSSTLHNLTPITPILPATPFPRTFLDLQLLVLVLDVVFLSFLPQGSREASPDTQHVQYPETLYLQQSLTKVDLFPEQGNSTAIPRVTGGFARVSEGYARGCPSGCGTFGVKREGKVVQLPDAPSLGLVPGVPGSPLLLPSSAPVEGSPTSPEVVGTRMGSLGVEAAFPTGSLVVLLDERRIARRAPARVCGSPSAVRVSTGWDVKCTFS